MAGLPPNGNNPSQPDAAEQVKKAFEDPKSVASQSVACYSDLLDDILLDIAVGVHRSVKTGQAQQEAVVPPPAWAAQQNNEGLAAFPLHATAVNQGSDLVLCINCGRKVVSTRFAQHLEKCLGRGRAASRLASRRY